MVRLNEAEFNLRESVPLPRYILHTWRNAPGPRGSDRIHWQGYVQWMTEAGNDHVLAQRMSEVNLTLPPDRSGYREERDGLCENRHLNDLVEFISVNVGGSDMDAKVSSPPMTYQSVGGVIVLRAWESHVHGEGRQLVGISTQNNRMRTQGNP
jgi:hypothetical protein